METFYLRNGFYLRGKVKDLLIYFQSLDLETTVHDYLRRSLH